MKKFILISVVVVLIASIGFTKENFKIFGRETSFLSPMEFELQTGIQKYKSSDVLWEVGYVPFRLTYGLLQNYEITIEFPYIFAKEDFTNQGFDGIGDLKITQKFLFTEELPDFPSFMGGISIEFPLSNKDLREAPIPLYTNDKVDFEIFFGSAKTFPEYQNIYLSADLGINFLGGGDETVFDYNLGVSRPLNDLIRFSLELDGQKMKDYNIMFLGTGLIISPMDTLCIKLGIPFGISSDAYSYGFVFKILNVF